MTSLLAPRLRPRARSLCLCSLLVTLGACATNDSAVPAARQDAGESDGSAVAQAASETALVAASRGPQETGATTAPQEATTKPQAATTAPQVAAAVPSPQPDSAAAVFAGGCFWCMEPPYDKLPGVLSTTSGYIGGHVANPTYEQVSAGTTGHTEAVRVIYDPSQVDYATLLDVFWHNIDPVAVDRQFCDVGAQYRSEIFYGTAAERRAAEASKRALEESGRFERPIATAITAATPFYAAEEYHQDYYTKNPLRYKFYRWSCGRDQRLEEIWGDAG